MKYINENEKSINCECEKCNRIFSIDKLTIDRRVPSGYYLNLEFVCECGDKTTFIKRVINELMCPKCCSNQLSANKKGFGLGKAAIGGLLLGGVGLLGGFIGGNKTIITCLKCGNKWQAGK